MAHTRSWDETTPLGTENASTADDYLRNHRVDLGERLEDMLYGFNASSNTAPENDYGVKLLRMYNQATAPGQADASYGHFYVKEVSGIPELFYHDDETTLALQLTSGGNLKSTAGLVVDGTSTLTGNVAAAGTLDVTGNIDPTSYETTNGGFIDDDAMGATATSTVVASAESIKAYADAAPAAQMTPTAYAAEESVTFPNGLVFKHGYKTSDDDGSTTITFAAAFATAIVSAQITPKVAGAVGSNYMGHIDTISTTTIVVDHNYNIEDGWYWQAWGY